MGVVEAAQMGWEQLFNRVTNADIEGTGEQFIKAFNARVALVRPINLFLLLMQLYEYATFHIDALFSLERRHGSTRSIPRSSNTAARTPTRRKPAERLTHLKSHRPLDYNTPIILVASYIP